MPTWFEVPKLTEGPLNGFVLWADFYRVHSMGLVDADWITTAFRSFWRAMAPIGVYRCTTVNPEWPNLYTPQGKGLRPGEYHHLLAVETMGSYSGSGGVTLQQLDRNPSLDLINESRIMTIQDGHPVSPKWWGTVAGHETGRAANPSGGPLRGTITSTFDPDNMMSAIADGEQTPSWTPQQIAAHRYTIELVRRQGLRYSALGTTFPVPDGGRPPWPLKES